jgi:CRISPR-associated protein Cas1
MTRLIVDTQGTRLRKVGARLAVQQEGDTLQSVPLETLEQVVLMGRGVHASTPLLYDLVRRGIDVVYQSQRGRFGFRLAGPLSKHSALRARQVLVANDDQRALLLARAVVVGKLHNQATVLQRLGEAAGERGRRAMETIQAQMAQAREVANLDSLRGHEGSGAAAYFAAWPALFDAGRWRFGGRAYYPPPDPVNAMLSLGYTLLLNDIVGAVYRIGLDPDIGFFHALDYGRPSLALDMEEEFRPVIVDTLVLSLIRGRVLEPSDFRQEEGERPRALLTDDARRFYLRSYEERMGVRVRHPGWDQLLTYRQCIERQVEHLARCILGREETYEPLLIQ